MPFNNQPIFRANGTIAPATFVKLDTTADHMVLQAGAGDRAIGVSQLGMKRAPGLPGSDNTIAAQQNDPIMVFGVGDTCEITAASAITRGDLLKSAAGGQAATSSADGDWVVGYALESASGAGVIIQMTIMPFIRGA